MNYKKRVKTSLFIAFLGATILILPGCNGNANTTEVFATSTKDTTPTPTAEGTHEGNRGNDNLTDNNRTDNSEDSKTPGQDLEEGKGKMISVYVCGQVATPDVYEVLESARVKEAVDLAGGFTKDAAKEAVNLARFVVDGEQIYIPSKEEVADGFESVEQSGSEKQNQGVTNTDSSRININTASKEALMTLPGIGEAKAESILEFRETQGAFQSIEDLMKITGIKEGVFSKIKDFITV